ncbi:hypothetical protein ACS0TY_030654 [Phlomoides rotata]
MGACASKFPLLKNAADAPLPAEQASREEVAVEKNGDESKPQSLGHLFKEEGEKGSAESNGEAYGDVKAYEPVADAPARDDSQKAAETEGPKSESLEEKKAEDGEYVEALNRAVEICGADKKPESPDTKKDEEQKQTADSGKEEEKPAETIELETEKKKDEEKPTESKKIETFEKTPETPDIDQVDEQIPASGAGEKKAEEKPADNIKIETSDKHVLEPLKTEKPSDEKSIEKNETKEAASDAKKPKAEEEKAQKPSDVKSVEKHETKEAASDAKKPKAEEEKAQKPSDVKSVEKHETKEAASDAKKPKAEEEKTGK